MKTTVITMVYSNKTVFEAGMKSLYATVDMRSRRHVLFDAHYPLNGPTRDELLSYANRPADLLLDSGKNEGLHGNANYVLRELDPTLDDQDLLAFYDADEDASHPGWLDAMERVFAADPACGWLSLMDINIHETLNYRKVPVTEVAGVRLRVPAFDLMNIACAWRVGALRKIGPLSEPFRWYGGLEVDAQPKFRRAGYWIGWLEDFWSGNHRPLADETYERYKRHHVGFSEPRFDGSFEEWLQTPSVNP